MSRWLQLMNGWFRPKFEANDNASDLFDRTWNDQDSGRRRIFMSIAFRTTSTGEIKDIGISHWSQDSIQQVAYHWRIGKKVETKDVIEFGKPDRFDFGATQTITAYDIVTVLDDWVLSLSGSTEELCIVMYGSQAINTLAKHWRSPIPVAVLDLEAVWCQRQNETVHCTFEEVAAATKSLANATSTLDHAGNQAYCLLTLLQSFGKKNKDRAHDFENSLE